jgi:hypothetical protein
LTKAWAASAPEAAILRMQAERMVDYAAAFPLEVD